MMKRAGAASRDNRAKDAEGSSPTSLPPDPVGVHMLRISLERQGWSVTNRGDHVELIPPRGTNWPHPHPKLVVRQVGESGWRWWAWAGTGTLICRVNYGDRASRLILSTLAKHTR
ncbi:hypothetical protein [Actinomadura rudentiformis]|uniref:Uncharacterized protein n=1 Tax=Actinomadura rudentiformis TaxID=359158 RepID=A0A6H9YCU4_9ACTN|nr:hypothetical protein [Actinomadura rudentiformis]KAB2341875.1 hypothetical protein F8566_40570 [Actinomadura rudentiformis]